MDRKLNSLNEKLLILDCAVRRRNSCRLFQHRKLQMTMLQCRYGWTLFSVCKQSHKQRSCCSSEINVWFISDSTHGITSNWWLLELSMTSAKHIQWSGGFGRKPLIIRNSVSDSTYHAKIYKADTSCQIPTYRRITETYKLIRCNTCMIHHAPTVVIGSTQGDLRLHVWGPISLGLRAQDPENRSFADRGRGTQVCPKFTIDGAWLTRTDGRAGNPALT